MAQYNVLNVQIEVYFVLNYVLSRKAHLEVGLESWLQDRISQKLRLSEILKIMPSLLDVNIVKY